MSDALRRVRLRRECLGQPIEAEAIVYPEGVHVAVHGGELPHIGAITIVDPGGNAGTTQFAGHKDAAISDSWARALLNCGCRPVVVAAGIHYDNLSPEGIRQVLAITDAMLDELIEAMGKA